MLFEGVGSEEGGERRGETAYQAGSYLPPWGIDIMAQGVIVGSRDRRDGK